MPSVTIDLPVEAFSGLGETPEEFVREMRLSASRPRARGPVLVAKGLWRSRC